MTVTLPLDHRGGFFEAIRLSGIKQAVHYGQQQSFHREMVCRQT